MHYDKDGNLIIDQETINIGKNALLTLGVVFLTSRLIGAIMYPRYVV